MKPELKVIALSVLFGLLAGLIDTLIDFFFFQQKSFIEVSITDVSAHDIWVRFALLGSFTAFGIVVSRVVEDRERSTRHYRKLLNSIHEKIVVLDRDYRIVDLNNGALETTGFDRAQVLGRCCHEVFHGYDESCDRYGEKCGLSHVFATGEPCNRHHRHVGRDGSIIDVDVLISPLKDSQGRVTHVIEAIRDVSDLFETQHRLRQTLQMSDDLLRAIPSGIFIYDFKSPGDLILVDANPAAENLTGVKLRDCKGNKFDQIWTEARGIGLTDRLLHVARTGETVDIEDLDYKDEKLDAAFRIRAFTLPNSRLAVAFEDITARKQAERQREGLIATMEAQNAELERFTYTVSHDLKSPLITIKGYIGTLSEDLSEAGIEFAKDDLARISNAADKMNTLLTDLLELSRIGRLVNPSQDVPLHELVRDALHTVGGQIEKNGVEISVAPDLPTVYGDPPRLSEVLQNLIDNAVKYMGDQPKPRIEIGVRQNANEQICCVRDNGIGIDPRYHDKVFGLFDQLDPKQEGTGIGLALTKRIVELHGGRIWIESDGEGCGSTFCFTIPSKRQD